MILFEKRDNLHDTTSIRKPIIPLFQAFFFFTQSNKRYVFAIQDDSV